MDDGQRRVLLLTGDGSHVQLPAGTLAGEDAIASSAGLPPDTRRRARSSISAREHGTAVRRRGRAGIPRVGRRRRPGARRDAAETVVENQWTHFAVVLDRAARADDVHRRRAAGQATNVTVTPAQIVPQAAGNSNRLFLGRAQDDKAPTLHGRLRDIRLYRIALGDEPSPRFAATRWRHGRRRPARRAAPEISTPTSRASHRSPRRRQRLRRHRGNGRRHDAAAAARRAGHLSRRQAARRFA